MTFHSALIAGVGGLALYGALKPSGEKVIIVNGEQKPAESSSTTATDAAASAAVTPVAPIASDATATPLATAASPVVPVVPVAVVAAPATPIDGTSVSPVSVATDPTTVVNTQPIPSEGSVTPSAPVPVPNFVTVTMAPPDVPPYSGASVHYDQIPTFVSETPLAPFPSNTPLAPFPSSQAPICAPGQDPHDPLMKCTPLTVAPMPTTVDGTATAQREVSEVPVASNTNQNLQAQAALKNSAVSCFTVVALNVFVIPILTLLMV